MNLLNFIRSPDPAKPEIFLYPEDLGDNPDTHRWRAQWETSTDGEVVGIALTAYPVMKKTPCGAQIDQFAFREATKQPWEEGAPAKEWFLSGDRRWVSDDGGQAWAKPTQEDAVRSIAIRLTRWAVRLRNDNNKLAEAAEALRVIRPDLGSFADKAAREIR